jgi:hypothetical protein
MHSTCKGLFFKYSSYEPVRKKFKPPNRKMENRIEGNSLKRKYKWVCILNMFLAFAKLML